MIGVGGIVTSAFEDSITRNAIMHDFSHGAIGEFNAGRPWLDLVGPHLGLEKVLRDFSWLILLHGSLLIPRHVVDAVLHAGDDRLEFGPVLVDLLARLQAAGLLEIVDLSDSLAGDKGAALFADATTVLSEIAADRLDYFFPPDKESGHLRFVEYSLLCAAILNERLAIAAGRPLLYSHGIMDILTYPIPSSRLQGVSGVIRDLIVPVISLIDDRWDIYTNPSKVNSRIALLRDLTNSSTGLGFRAMVSTVLDGVAEQGAVTEANEDLLRESLRWQKSHRTRRRITTLSMIGSGAVGLFEPLTGAIGFVASLIAPLILNRMEEKRWTQLDSRFPGIKYLYKIGEELQSRAGDDPSG